MISMQLCIMAKIASPPLGPVEPASEDLDDYMSMTIAEPPKSAEKETYTQRRIRKQREVRPYPTNPLEVSLSN